MKKIIMIFAAMAAVLSSCSKNEIESGLTTESKDIVLDISVSYPGADDTKALIKDGWAAGDEISIWFNTNTGSTPDLVIEYDGSNWAQKGDAPNVPTSGSGYVKAVYKKNVIVASKDNYSVSGNTLSFKIEIWKVLTEIQVVVKGLWSENASKYTLSCDKFTPLASSGNGYTVEADNITVSSGTEGTATNGISNKDGIAFVFATADYSSSSAEKKYFTFTITETGGIQQTYKPNVAIVAKDGKKSIKALTFANPNYVEIPAMYNGSTTTALKWYRQNLAITGSGKGDWTPGGSSTVTVPGTKENVIIGDYFQWGASYAGYNITVEKYKIPENLLIYTSFTNTGTSSGNSFTFKSPGATQIYYFNRKDKNNETPQKVGIAPHYVKNVAGDDGNYSEYTSTGATLDSSDDAARIILGSSWRMPTKTEFEAMKAATYWAWDVNAKGYYVYDPQSNDAGKKNNDSGVLGTYNTTDALLFFPATGSTSNENLQNPGLAGCYWSREVYSEYKAYTLFINASNLISDNKSDRYSGYSIRPVSD